jgi:predicted DNA-binding protein
MNDYKPFIGTCNGAQMTTTIPLEKETRERLRSLGRKGETYDQVVKRLISIAEYEEFMTRQYERLKDKNAFVSLDEI